MSRGFATRSHRGDKCQGLSRRQFLAHLAGGAAAVGLAWPAGLLRGDPAAPAGRGLPVGAAADPLGGPRSRLVSVVNRVVVKGDSVAQRHLARMLSAGLTRFCGTDTEREAWMKLIRPGEKILMKFNRSGAHAIGTTDAMLRVLLASLATADIRPDRVMLLDVTAEQQRKSTACQPVLGYRGEPVAVLGRQEYLLAALDWADCIINIPFLKDHHLAGVTCAMKNLSHGLIKYPARWHGDAGAPLRQAIANLFALPAIRGKLRLTICNALRIVYAGGPDARQETIVDAGQLLLATDPVALDAHAARLIDHERGARGLKDLTEDRRPPDYLAVAREMNLGQSDLDQVDLTELEA